MPSACLALHAAQVCRAKWPIDKGLLSCRFRQKLDTIVVLLQKAYRGHSHRTDMRHNRRKTQLWRHVQQGAYSEALQLVMCKQERWDILRAQAARQTRVPLMIRYLEGALARCLGPIGGATFMTNGPVA